MSLQDTLNIQRSQHDVFSSRGTSCKSRFQPLLREKGLLAGGGSAWTHSGVYIPTCYRWDMEKTTKLDSKGRVVIPPDLREGLGDHIVIRKTEDGIVLVPGTKEDRVTEFLKILESEPKRTGKPSNPGPEKMKSIWKESA